MTNGGGSDAALWLEATSGTEGSFGLLFDRHSAELLRRASAGTREVPDAHDVLAMVFLEAWRQRSKARFADGSLLPWLRQLLDEVMSDRRRATRRWRRELAAQKGAGTAGGAPLEAIRAALLRHLRSEGERRRATVRRRVAMGLGAGLVLVASASIATAAIVGSHPPPDPDIVYCLASPHRGSDGQFTFAAASLHSSLPGAGDPISVCRDMWQRGALDPGADQLAATPTPRTPPVDLQVCTMDDGSPAVVPGRPGVCRTAGLAPAR